MLCCKGSPNGHRQRRAVQCLTCTAQRLPRAHPAPLHSGRGHRPPLPPPSRRLPRGRRWAAGAGCAPRHGPAQPTGQNDGVAALHRVRMISWVCDLDVEQGRMRSTGDTSPLCMGRKLSHRNEVSVPHHGLHPRPRLTSPCLVELPTPLFGQTPPRLEASGMHLLVGELFWATEAGAPLLGVTGAAGRVHVAGDSAAGRKAQSGASQPIKMRPQHLRRWYLVIWHAVAAGCPSAQWAHRLNSKGKGSRMQHQAMLQSFAIKDIDS